MKSIKINSIKYKYFNGFKDFTLILDGQNGQVFGRNDAGKTSLENGYLWLLFGKDQNGKTFSPKPKDSLNQEIIGLEPSVEMELLVDGQKVTLIRTLTESWTKKRGELETTRGNDTTKYAIDGVPKKEKEFKDYLNSLADESILTIMTNSKGFMQLAWKDRRNILVGLTGLTDEDIMASSPELSKLADILSGKSIDDHRKILAAEKKEVLKSIDGLPGRIQENTDAIERLLLKDLTRERLQENIKDFDSKIETAESKLAVIQSGNVSSEYQEQLSKLRLKETEARGSFVMQENTTVSELQAKLFVKQQFVNTLRGELNDAEMKVYHAETSLTEKQNLREKLLNEYHSITANVEATKALTFDEHQKTCPTCAQDLPEHQVVELVEKFNLEKSRKLEKLNADLAVNKETGLANKTATTEIQKELAQFKSLATSTKSQLDQATKELDEVNSKLNFEKSKEIMFEQTGEYKAIQQEILAVQNKLNSSNQGSNQELFKIKEELAELRKDQESVKFALTQFDRADEFSKRISELRAEDKRLKDLNAKIEKELFLIDEFTRTKVKMLEESINDKFSYVQFKLFNEQKNGGLAEVCEATVNGIEYSSGLNTSARVKADIDIHNVLSTHYGLSMPIFIDNAEGINKGKLPETIGQRVELIVAENEELKVEVIN